MFEGQARVSEVRCVGCFWAVFGPPRAIRRCPRVARRPPTVEIECLISTHAPKTAALGCLQANGEGQKGGGAGRRVNRRSRWTTFRSARGAIGAQRFGAQNRKLEAAPIAIIHSAAAPTAAGFGDLHWWLWRDDASRIGSAHPRTHYGGPGGETARSAGAPESRFASPAVRPATSSGDELPGLQPPLEALCQIVQAGTAPRRTHLHLQHPPTRLRRPTQADSPKIAST